MFKNNLSFDVNYISFDFNRNYIIVLRINYEKY